MYEGKIESVGWGIRYKDIKVANTDIPQQVLHSCKTNEFGPINSAYRPCDVVDLTNNKPKGQWGCNMSDKPNGYNEIKCK